MAKQKTASERDAVVSGKLPSDPYKGVRDFYPADMAAQQYIFDIWSYTAELFGFERYDASVLEPAELYKSKGAANEEIVNEQTYTFEDRGGREVTLRPEMTPTVARMVARRRRELSYPLRWYSIPNLFRYERSQRGRLREHWQLNADIFGVDDTSADIEIILLADAIFKNVGAENGVHYEIRVSSRKVLDALYETVGLSKDNALLVTRLADRMRKMQRGEFEKGLKDAAGDAYKDVLAFFDATDIADIPPRLQDLPAVAELRTLIETLRDDLDVNVVFDPSIVRGFDYYTGTVFEIFDTDPKNNRSLLGGGRYDNLTELFGGEAVPGVGFGMGDVTMRDFLETHKLMTVVPTAPAIMVVPTEKEYNIAAEKRAQQFRDAGIAAAVDMSSKKLGKKISAASERAVSYVLVLGEDEARTGRFALKNLADGTEISGTLDELVNSISS